MEQAVESYALALHRAEQQRIPIAPLSERNTAITPEQAYAIQRAWQQIKDQEDVHLVGHKIGLTSLAMQRQLGVDQPDYGFLLDTMVVSSGSTLAIRDFIAPRIEPEIAFWLADDVRGPGVTAPQVLAATHHVCAALELVDSRIEAWRIKLVDTIADNASSDRKSTRLNSSHQIISYAVFCLKKKNKNIHMLHQMISCHKGDLNREWHFGSFAPTVNLPLRPLSKVGNEVWIFQPFGTAPQACDH